MKHRDLIQAALNGKQIQFRSSAGLGKRWVDFENLRSAVAHMSAEYPSYEYRIKPEPVPDKVLFGVVLKNGQENIARRKQRGYHNIYDQSCLVKVTIKTDENGAETRTVELV